MSNLLDSEDDGLMILSSLSSESRKNKDWRSIKKGSAKLICSTGSELFQDFKKLKKIYLIEPQKWYYAHQQDPRYKVRNVLEKLAELHHAELTFLETEEL